MTNANLGLEHAFLYLLLALSSVIAWEGVVIARFAEDDRVESLHTFLIRMGFLLILLVICGVALIVTNNTFGTYLVGLTIAFGAVFSVIAVPFSKSRHQLFGKVGSRPFVIATASAVGCLVMAFVYVTIANLFGANIQVRILYYVLNI